MKPGSSGSGRSKPGGNGTAKPGTCHILFFQKKTHHMIPSHELRLGNYVLVEKNLRQVSMINDTSSTTRALTGATADKIDENTSQRLELLQPVPLTDAVLRQCNFVYHDYFKFWQLITGEGENRSEMDIDKDGNVLDFMRKPIVKRVASLHQLQNIYFMLKGKELAFRNEV